MSVSNVGNSGYSKYVKGNVDVRDNEGILTVAQSCNNANWNQTEIPPNWVKFVEIFQNHNKITSKKDEKF